MSTRANWRFTARVNWRFTATDARVTVNGQDVSGRINHQQDNSITLAGNKKKLNLHNGGNQITVMVNGSISNVFDLTL